MAVDFIGSIQEYQGLTNDEKPEDGVPVGSRFQEIDRGKRLFTLTSVGWVLGQGSLPVRSVTDYEQAMLALMRDVRNELKSNTRKVYVCGENGRLVKTTERGELITAPLKFSDPFSVNCNVDDTAFNLVTPITGQQFVVRGALISGNRDIGVNGSVFLVYGATSDTSLTVATTVIDVEVPKSSVFPFVVPDVIVPEGEFINAKCDDNSVKVTLYGYRVPQEKD